MQWKRVSIVILLLALFTTNCSKTDTGRTDLKAQGSDQTVDVAFKTPEEAITSYLDGVARNDVRKILQATAVNEMGAKFKFDLYAERVGGMNPSYLSPADNPFYSEINKAYLSSQILGQVKILSYSLLSSEKVDGSIIPQADAARVNGFIKDVDPGRLSKLELKKISLPDKTVMSDARYLENAAKSARIFGADESTERLALLSFDGNYYYLGFTLLRYGADWKISSQVSPLASTDPLGAAKKITEEEFEKMINGH